MVFQFDKQSVNEAEEERPLGFVLDTLCNVQRVITNPIGSLPALKFDDGIEFALKTTRNPTVLRLQHPLAMI
jgi:hypothetical protein